MTMFRSEIHENIILSVSAYSGLQSGHKKHQTNLFEQLSYAHILLAVLLHNLGHGHLEVLLGDVNPPLPECVHPSLGTDSLHLGSGASAHLLGNLPQVDSSGQVHPPAVDLQDVQPGQG